jgi:hypothetical protein
MAVNPRKLDFTNVKEGGGQFRKTRQVAGDYRGQITKVAEVAKKGDKDKKMWLFTIKVGSGIYPLYCGFGPDELWKLRNLFVAAGKNVPRKMLNTDPNLIVGKTIGVTLEDDEYDNKKQSSIAATFPTSELSGEDDDSDDEDDSEEDEDDEDDEEDDEEEEPPSPPKKDKKKKKKSKVSDDELEELDIEDI